MYPTVVTTEETERPHVTEHASYHAWHACDRFEEDDTVEPLGFCHCGGFVGVVCEGVEAEAESADGGVGYAVR